MFLEEEFKLVGFSKFVRANPRSDRFGVKQFHHVEFWCTDATNTARRFSWGLGMPVVAKFDLSTGNATHVSYLLSFSAKHGLAVRALAIEVEDAGVAFDNNVAHGARPSTSPILLQGENAELAEVELYGDVVLRYISYKKKPSDSNSGSWFLPGFQPVEELSSFPLDYGIRRLDHAVGNVPELVSIVEYVKELTGFHAFAEFTTEDVRTNESGLN